MSLFFTIDNRLTHGNRFKCDNCGTIHKAGALAGILFPSFRLTPGEELPAGECPDCGALSYVVKSYKELEDRLTDEEYHALKQYLNDIRSE